MSGAATAKNWPISRAPKRVTLRGEKDKQPEPAEHIIEFPGGAVEVSRTSDGDYWAHIIVNRGFADADGEGRESARGEVVDGRIDSATGVRDVPNTGSMTQIAIRIRPSKKS